jgi:hypothetical protein
MTGKAVISKWLIRIQGKKKKLDHGSKLERHSSIQCSCEKH